MCVLLFSMADETLLDFDAKCRARGLKDVKFSWYTGHGPRMDRQVAVLATRGDGLSVVSTGHASIEDAASMLVLRLDGKEAAR